MKSIICSLFEGNYHYGIAALINSLYKQGFRGDCYIGFKGDLPNWAIKSAEKYETYGKEILKIKIASKLNLHFVRVTADYHLTNYKPNFMLEIWELSLKDDIDAIFYFDPDIIVKVSWSYFEEWVGYGIALVHDLSFNIMPATHPKRRAWEKVIEKGGKKINNSLNSYINAGFCGILKANKEFLTLWKEIFELGVSFFGLSNNQWKHNYPETYLFFKQDQDALNIAAMCTSLCLSEMGPEAMDFIPNGYVMSHRVDKPKPWEKNFIIAFLNGNKVNKTDRLFWKNVDFPIKPFNNLYVTNKLICIKLTSFLSRFYKK